MARRVIHWMNDEGQPVCGAGLVAKEQKPVAVNPQRATCKKCKRHSRLRNAVLAAFLAQEKKDG